MKVAKASSFQSRSFVRTRPIRYSDCDTAGIVFFPRYFLMVSDHIECWFDEYLDLSYRHLNEDHKVSVCTLEIKAEFLSAAQYGEKIKLALLPKCVESDQILLTVQGSASAMIKFKAEVLLRFTDFETDSPIEIPQIVLKHLKLT